MRTLEEIVDWQPYDHVGWRIAVPSVGSVVATADLETADGGTRLRRRWTRLGTETIDAGEIARFRAERESAFARLTHVLAGALPVIERELVAPSPTYP